ncbi:class I SAM-dependent methyltransferase [Streptomyces sp. NPDC005805]|uniref:class I SAM-dependent DNA methyltransferase n=1 Tax=Streptomyces sp. NPDC005805 TaxID=3157068 RepID=UPI0033EC6A51
MQEPASAAELFDALGKEYETAFAGAEGQRRSVEWMIGQVPDGGRVLDVGSGTGRPVAAALAAAGLRVTGMDVSPVMVELAARQVPEARFVRADIRAEVPEPGRYEGACAYFSLLQMSREEQRAVVARIAGSLVPGGVCALGTVPLDLDGVVGTWMGHTVRLTSFPPDGFVRLAEDAGLDVVEVNEEVFTPATELARVEPQLYVHCRRPA